MGSVGRTFSDIGTTLTNDAQAAVKGKANIGQIATLVTAVPTFGTSVAAANIISHPTDLGPTIAIGAALAGGAYGAAALEGTGAAGVAAAPSLYGGGAPLAADAGTTGFSGVLLAPGSASIGSDGLLAAAPGIDGSAALGAGLPDITGASLSSAASLSPGYVAAADPVASAAAAANLAGPAASPSGLLSTLGNGLVQGAKDAWAGLTTVAGAKDVLGLLGVGSGSKSSSGSASGGGGVLSDLGSLFGGGGSSGGDSGPGSTTINQASVFPSWIMIAAVAVLGFVVAKKYRWIVLLISLGIVTAPARAQWQPTAGTQPHNHTGPTDGGQLSNLNVLGSVTSPVGNFANLSTGTIAGTNSAVFVASQNLTGLYNWTYLNFSSANVYELDYLVTESTRGSSGDFLCLGGVPTTVGGSQCTGQGAGVYRTAGNYSTSAPANGGCGANGLQDFNLSVCSGDSQGSVVTGGYASGQVYIFSSNFPGDPEYTIRAENTSDRTIGGPLYNNRMSGYFDNTLFISSITFSTIVSPATPWGAGWVYLYAFPRH